MDPYAVLGVAPTASAEEVARAYRAKAKEWHPDVRGTEDALRRMAVINAAYEQIRNGKAVKPAAAEAPRRRRRRAGDWLAEDVRRALGPELLRALSDGEDVRLITPTSTWASPQTLLVVTDRRLLWLLDDAISHRVRSLDLAAVTEATERPKRRSVTVRVSRRGGRAIEFADLPAATAAAVVSACRSG
jgi:DnaJ domain